MHNCPVCQAELKSASGRGRPPKFCSDKCRYEFHNERRSPYHNERTVECKGWKADGTKCHKRLKVGGRRGRPVRFCSPVCRRNYRKRLLFG